MKLKQTDMAVMFFVTVRHNGGQPLRAMATMVECCEKITEEDTDCDMMDLYGGDFGIIEPGAVRNFTFVYPNLYGDNRRGYCVVSILHRCPVNSENGEIHHNIDFDTRTSTEDVPVALQGWYEPNSFINCETPDLDPFDHCNPVNCQEKYSGYRNFFNQKWKICQRVPTCLADPKKELPDIAYMPNSNTCRDLEAAITKEDIDLLARGQARVSELEQKIVNIRCHHGEIDPRTGLCVCYPGWKSEPFDEDSCSLPGAIYSMCNIRCHSQNDDYRFLPPIVGLLLAIWVVFFVVFCESCGCFCPPKRNTGTCAPEATLYFPLRDSNEGSTFASFLASTRTSFDGLKQNHLSSVNTPYCKSEKSPINRSFRGSSKSGLSFFSERKT